MLVIDTSVIFAIFGNEPEGSLFSDMIVTARPTVCISAGNVIEAHRVAISKGGTRSATQVDRLLRRLDVEIIPVDAAQVAFARDGMERFGKGRGAAPAVLNFGDLFAYALARARAAPLLFKGTDFSLTDVIPAWTP